MRINSCNAEDGLAHDLREITCPRIEELNLSSNLLNSWEEVGRIAQQLSSLKVLNVRYASRCLPVIELTIGLPWLSQ